MPLTYKIAKYVDGSRSVSVTFTDGDINHTRDVNAVFNDDGKYNKIATEDRVKEVALGVAHKIAVGTIKSDVVEDTTE